MTSNDLEQEVMRVLSLAMDQPSDQQEAWIEQNYGDQPDLKERVLKLLRRDGSAPSLLRTGGARSDATEPEMPERAGNYKITELIGQGGMGAVYKGRRDSGDFEHVAAIKVVRPGLFSDALTARFERERQTLAGLNHPGIARLFDGGTLPDGSPYIVMELVDGISLTQWIETNPSNQNAILGLFEQICDAVNHAHQNLIIHRDLTPSNVLVAGDDTIKLIDFGIAKPQSIDEADDGVSSDSLASLSFTPGFAAPERSQGAPANTLSDVYSLGKLLEAMLKRARPDSDLKSIMARASAQAPEHRYDSVVALRDDIRSYQRGYPVNAREGSTSYRLGKYFKRRRLLVSFASVSVIFLMAAFATTLVQYQRAEVERVAADARFEDVRELAGFMMFELYDELEKAPGNTKAIEMLADRSLTYLESLESDERASVDVKIDTGAGLKRLADIFGNPKNQNLGRRAEAGDMLDRSEEYLSNLLAEYPEDVDVQRKLAETKFANAIHKYVSDDENEHAHELASEAAALLRPISELPTATFSDKAQFVRARMMSAVPLPWIKRPEEGIEILTEVRASAAELLANDPKNLEAQSLLGSMNVELARAIIRYENTGGEVGSTLPYWNEAVELRLAVHEAEPDDARAYRSLVSIYAERSAALRGDGRYEESLRDLEAAIGIGEELLALDPDDAWLSRMTGGAKEEKIKTLSFSGRHQEATALVAEAHAKARQEYEANPNNSGVTREWAFTQILFADAYLAAGVREEGCKITQSARAAWTSFDEMSGISDHDLLNSIKNLEALEAKCV